MEMNRMSPQKEPARESGIEENPADHSAATEIVPEPLYDPAEAETIVRLLTTEGLFDPERSTSCCSGRWQAARRTARPKATTC